MMRVLNSMFNEMSNATFNNKVFNSGKIERMNEQMERLYFAAKALKGVAGQSELARALNQSPQTVKNWEARGVSKKGMLIAEREIGCSAVWVETGIGQMRNDGQTNITPGPDLRGRVPIISWVQAGDWQQAVDNFHPGSADDWVEITCQKKTHTFALRVKGDSMVNPNGAPSFPEGFILVVEPEMEPAPGDFVIAKNGENEATFKQLIKDGGDWYLKPLNPRYPLKALGDARIVGVVREATLRFK